MAKDTIFKFRISDELLDKVRQRAANISEYLRDLIRADINQHPEELRDLPKTPYTYHAKLINVIDGDTLELDIDVGFSTSRQDKVRLARINSPEIDTPAGKKAKRFIQQRLQGSHIIIETRKREKYGAPGQAGYFLLGESPGRAGVSHPPVSSVARKRVTVTRSVHREACRPQGGP